MGVISLDSYIRKTFPSSVRYTKTGSVVGEEVGGKIVTTHFKGLFLDANPFVYAAAVKAFESDAILKEHDDKTYEEKIQMVFEFTWAEICQIVAMVECEEVYIAFDGPAPRAKTVQQRTRRYPRELPAEGQFDTTQISCGTHFMQDLCTFIEFKIQEVNGWGKPVTFSGHTVPGEGEHKVLDKIRTYPANTRVCMYGPDGDLIMLGLASNLDFYLLKADYSTRNDCDPQYYTIRMKWIKEALTMPVTPKQHWADMDENTPMTAFARKIPIGDATKSFVFLGMFLGNDFVPRLEIFDLFINGIDDLYTRYNPIGKRIVYNGRVDKFVFTKLLTNLAAEEANLLAKRTKNPFPLLEKHLEAGKLDFTNFRKEYYKDWVHIEETQIEEMCHNYLDTIWWCWIYYTRGCPTPNHFYKYHYPPFCCDLQKASVTWRIPQFQMTPFKTPFQQLVAILPPNRKELLPEKYHHLFEGPAFPKLKNVVKNSQGKDPKFEATFELPFFTDVIDVQHNHKHPRNTLTKDRVFTPGKEKFKVKSKWGKCVTTLSG